MAIRYYQSGDHVAVGNIFQDAVHRLAAKDYTPEQLSAWAPPDIDFDHWKWRCELKRPFVCERDGEAAGFLALDPDGYVDWLFVHSQHAHQGVGSELLSHAVSVCNHLSINKMHAQVSRTARVLFERHGFWVIRPNTVIRHGVELQNFMMERWEQTTG